MCRVIFDVKNRKAATDAIRFSRIIHAPLGFVYRWCTDYREDDNRITGSKSRRRILERTKERVIYAYGEKGAKSVGAANIVTLHPPNRWHVDSISEDRDSTGDYRLTKLKSTSTRLDILFRTKRKSSAAPSKSKFLEHLGEIWSKYISALERDYKRQKR